MITPASLTTVEQVADFISKHPTEELITRRQLIKFGSASIVDGIIFKLVHITGSLVRVAWGCYRKRERVAAVTEEEVARVKAAAFGRTIVSSPREFVLNLSSADQLPPLEFLTNGRTSSFRFGTKKIILRGASPRKMALGDNKIAQTIRALWHLGKSKVNESLIGKLTESFNSFDRLQTGKLCASMPAWLAEYFYPWRLLDEVKRPESDYSKFDQKWRVEENAAVYDFRFALNRKGHIVLRC